MRFDKIDHKDGSKSIHLIPEGEEEVRQLAMVFSQYPGGCSHKENVEQSRVRIEVPAITKDGLQWDPPATAIGDAEIKSGVFTCAIWLGYK